MNASHKTLAALAFAVAISSVGNASAEDAKSGAPTAATATADMTNGEIRKIDKDAKKITLKHEDIKNLDMPGMTMVFQVKDVTLLDKAKAGDKVKFKAIKEGTAFIVTDIQPVK